MITRDLQWVSEVVGGRLAGGEARGLSVSSVGTDSRRLIGGELFVALVGDRFDAHDHLEDAVAGGASGLLVERLPEGFHVGEASLPVVMVDDTLAALQALGRAVRREVGPWVLGVTGSSGKTSTKDLLDAVLGMRWKTRTTAGNLNNHIGVPLTLLSLAEGDEVAVVEMGMSNRGEIAALAAIAEPDAAVLTMIGTAHIEHLGSREEIALEKGDLAAAVGRGGLVVLNADDDQTAGIASRCVGRVITAGLAGGDVRAEKVSMKAGAMRFWLAFPDGHGVEVELPLLGDHMVANACLAAAVGWERGLSVGEIAAGLAGVRLTAGRLGRLRVGGFEILDDSYNANPDSMRAGLRALMMVIPAGGGRRAAVMGHMAELGELEADEHLALGRELAASGVDALFVVGERAAVIADGAREAGGIEIWEGRGAQECAQALRDWRREGDVLLVKGSRSAAMEKVIEELERGER
jgi:UDP-N-acetylmuramoyl-tripeptide--D-alanyl-D-alanine ligase